MPTTPTSVDWYFYDDIGYTEGSSETPYRGHNDLPPHSDFFLNKRPPAISEMFSYVKLPTSYPNARSWKYLKMELTYSYGGATPTYVETYYGWIDKVELLSHSFADNLSMSMVGVSWHVDLWRTYIDKVELKRGVILRRGAVDLLATPPQNPTFFAKAVAEVTPLIQRKDELWWIFFSYVNEVNNATTAVKYYCFPIRTDEYGILAEDDSNAYQVPSINEFLEDRWDEKLGLTPSRLTGAFISPIAPMPYTITDGTNGKVISFERNMQHPQWTRVKIDSDAQCACWESVGLYDYVFEEKLLFPFETYDNTTEVNPKSFTPNDVSDFVLTGLSGEYIGRLPFGKTMRYYQYRIVASAVNMYIQIRWKDEYSVTPDFLDAGANGLTFDIPLVPIDTASNSWSEYNYSGAREYDRAQRAEQLRYSRETQLIDTVTSMGISAGGTAIGAAAGGSVGALGGAGGLISGAGNLIGLGVHTALGLEENHNNNLDSIKNRYVAKQSDSLSHSGAGLDIIAHGKDISMNELAIDGYSELYYTNEIAQFGYKVCEPTADCDSFVNAAGPLQIDDLNVKTKLQFAPSQYYKVPIEAIRYIKSRLKRGVLLV